jgi:exocyst complex component 8
MTDLAQQTGMNDSAKEVAERDARWIGDFADQLTVAIALREWDTAVDLVEQGIFFPTLNACHQPPFDIYSA